MELLLPPSLAQHKDVVAEKLLSDVRATFGEHTDLDILNRAYRDIYPDVESWGLTIDVRAPYTFGNFQQARIWNAPNAMDTIMLLPLKTETVNTLPISAKVVDISALRATSAPRME